MAHTFLGRYEVIGRLAVGGMGEVFLGRLHASAAADAALGAGGTGAAPARSKPDVVVKTLLPELADEPEHVAQFLSEARVASALTHPGIARTLEVGCDRGTYYLVMERIDGEDLGKLLRATAVRGEPIPVPVAARIVHDAAEALHAAHTATGDDGQPLGIVHRDVSPQNIMVARHGATKVVDFGIAKSSLAAHRTRTGTIKGKVAYTSPEQATGGLVDARSDQFSLGIVAWNLRGSCSTAVRTPGSVWSAARNVAAALSNRCSPLKKLSRSSLYW